MPRASTAIALLAAFVVCHGARAAEPVLRNSLGMKLVAIPAGEFTMGAGEQPPTTREQWNQRDHDEAPAHRVAIRRAFHLGATEVTNAQYERFDPDHAQLREQYRGGGPDAPVAMVTWQQAVDFCNWLSKREDRHYRLPTEAEWEYACRAGTQTPFHCGEKLTPAVANYGIGHGKRPGPIAVGSLQANAWGLYDMHGNVAEWCHDWYGPYEAERQFDPVGRVSGTARVVRGWSYLPANHKLGTPRYCRSANRSGLLPEDANRVTGFRVALGPPPETKPAPLAEPPIHQENVRQSRIHRKVSTPDQPYFASVAESVKVPDDAWGPIFGHWNHYSTIVVCPNGDLLAAWYTTVSEAGRECAQAATRLRADTGKWDPPAFFFGTPDCNTHAPVLLSDGKRLYHFFTQSLRGWDNAAVCLRTSDDSGSTWTRSRIIVSREHPRTMSQPCSAFVAADGRLVLAVDGDFGHRDERVLTSRDRGATWTVAEGDMRAAVGQYAIHPAIVQRDDGAYQAFLRGPDPMPVVVSPDAGQTWRARSTTLPGIGVGQKAAAMKLSSGALLICSFDGKRKILGGRRGDTSSTFAALSFDDGQTWSHVRPVEGPSGYLSVTQSADGTIYLLGPNKRTGQIRCAAFNEAWLKQGPAVEEKTE